MSGQTILVVEDERSISEVVSLYLTRAGYHVVTVHDGAAALRAYSQQKPALIVLDLMLPGVDGLEITRRVRAEGETPIIMLTARRYRSAHTRPWLRLKPQNSMTLPTASTAIDSQLPGSFTCVVAVGAQR